MSFSASWHTLLDNVDELPPETTLLTPLSRKPFRVKDVQEHRILVEYRDDDETIPLQRDQFETLFERIGESRSEFELDRLPPDAEPYATVLSLHPRFELDDRDGTLTESDTPTSSPLVDGYQIDREEDDRNEPEIRSMPTPFF
jgi:hypothetical protein